MRQKGFILLPVIIIVILIGVLGYFIYQNTQLQKNGGNLTAPSVIPTVNSPKSSLTLNSTANWKTYTDPKYNYSFKYPTRYEIEKPMFEALPEGEVSFNAGSKADSFWIDAVSFNGTLDQFVSKYTAYDPVPKVVMTNLNVSSPLGELVNQNDTTIRLYKYTNHYDQNINPEAKDIINYTGFIVSGNFGYILRSENGADNLFEIDQILSTFKFLVQSTPNPVNPNRLLLATVEGVANFVIDLPTDFSVSTQNNVSDVTFGNSTFQVIGNLGGMGGPCPMDNSDPSCGYTDETVVKNIQILRIWKNKNGIFLINPQEIIIDGYDLNNIEIEKTKPNQVFTTAEVDKWRTVLQNITVVK